MLTVDNNKEYGTLKDYGPKPEMTLNAPLYLGGVPKGAKFQSLKTTGTYGLSS